MGAREAASAGSVTTAGHGIGTHHRPSQENRGEASLASRASGPQTAAAIIWRATALDKPYARGNASLKRSFHTYRYDNLTAVDVGPNNRLETTRIRVLAAGNPL